MRGGTPEPDAAASLMNAFAQLLPIPSTSWSFFHLMSFIRCDTDQCTQPLHHSSQARWLLQLRVPRWAQEPPGATAAATAGRGAGTGSGRDALCGLRMPAGHSAPRASASPERCQGRSPALAAHQLTSEVPVCSELCEQLCNTPPGTTGS